MADWGSALIGAMAALAVGFGLEAARTRRERSAVAAAIAGEMSALLEAARQVDLVGTVDRAIQHIADGKHYGRGSGARLENYNPVFDKIADKIGVLPPLIARDVAIFYHKLWAFRRGMSDISTGAFDSNPDHQDKKLRLLKFNRNLAVEMFSGAESTILRIEAFRDRRMWISD